MPQNKYFIIDFDSTLTQVGALEELASISLKNNPNKADILAQIKEITNAGMEGRITITESLSKRLKLLQADKAHLELLIRILKRKITASFLRNKKFFRANRHNIFIISNGFKEFIVPVAKKFGILEKNIFANTFIFDNKGKIIGFDEANVLSQEKGKIKKIVNLLI